MDFTNIATVVDVLKKRGKYAMACRVWDLMNYASDAYAGEFKYHHPSDSTAHLGETALRLNEVLIPGMYASLYLKLYNELWYKEKTAAEKDNTIEEVIKYFLRFGVDIRPSKPFLDEHGKTCFLSMNFRETHAAMVNYYSLWVDFLKALKNTYEKA